MLPYTLKFTLRGAFRDITRGLLARHLVYPRIARNETSADALAAWIRRVAPSSSNHPLGLRILGESDTYIDKDSVRAHPERFIRPRTLGTLARNRIKTSGSTGRPLTLVQDFMAVVKEEAFVYRQLRWAGYRHGDRRVWLRGDVVCKGESGDGRFGCRDWWNNTLMLSSYHIAAHTAAAYVAAIETFDPVLIQAYPSSIHEFASWMKMNARRYEGQSLRGIVTSSETLTGDMQRCIEEVFGCRVFDWYGQAERVLSIGTCDRGARHVMTDYGLAELLPAGGSRYELVGSGYNNRAMPLAHYRTGDFVTLGASGCACGRPFPVVARVEGRADKSIVLPDGRQIGRLDHVFKGLDNVVEGQVVYRGDGHFVLRVVPGPHWGHTDAQRLIANLHSRVEGVSVEVEETTAIARGANGKFEFVKVEARP